MTWRRQVNCPCKLVSRKRHFKSGARCNHLRGNRWMRLRQILIGRKEVLITRHCLAIHYQLEKQEYFFEISSFEYLLTRQSQIRFAFERSNLNRSLKFPQRVAIKVENAQS